MKVWILFCISYILKAAVIGIDLGSQFIKVGLISPGKPFRIVENIESKRKTENAVAFIEGERLFESSSVRKRNRYPSNSFVNLKKFLGIGKNHFNGVDYEDVIKKAEHNYETFSIKMNEERDSF